MVMIYLNLKNVFQTIIAGQKDMWQKMEEELQMSIDIIGYAVN